MLAGALADTVFCRPPDLWRGASGRAAEHHDTGPPPRPLDVARPRHPATEADRRAGAHAGEPERVAERGPAVRVRPPSSSGVRRRRRASARQLARSPRGQRPRPPTRPHICQMPVMDRPPPPARAGRLDSARRPSRADEPPLRAVALLPPASPSASRSPALSARPSGSGSTWSPAGSDRTPGPTSPPLLSRPSGRPPTAACGRRAGGPRARPRRRGPAPRPVGVYPVRDLRPGRSPRARWVRVRTLDVVRRRPTGRGEPRRRSHRAGGRRRPPRPRRLRPGHHDRRRHRGQQPSPSGPLRSPGTPDRTSGVLWS